MECIIAVDRTIRGSSRLSVDAITDLNDRRLFAEVGRAWKLHGGCAQPRVHTSKLSRRIRALEEELGVRPGVPPIMTASAPAVLHRTVGNQTSVSSVESRSSVSESVVVANESRSSAIRWSALSVRWSRSRRY
jgi:hypothetical protein